MTAPMLGAREKSRKQCQFCAPIPVLSLACRPQKRTRVTNRLRWAGSGTKLPVGTAYPNDRFRRNRRFRKQRRRRWGSLQLVNERRSIFNRYMGIAGSRDGKADANLKLPMWRRVRRGYRFVPQCGRQILLATSRLQQSTMQYVSQIDDFWPQRIIVLCDDRRCHHA